jgi:hypothetical protein
MLAKLSKRVLKLCFAAPALEQLSTLEHSQTQHYLHKRTVLTNSLSSDGCSGP